MDEVLHRHATQLKEIREMVQDVITLLVQGRENASNHKLKDLLYRVDEFERKAWDEWKAF